MWLVATIVNSTVLTWLMGLGHEAMYFLFCFVFLNSITLKNNRRQIWEQTGGGHGNPLQYSCLDNAHGQRSLAGYSPWGSQRAGHD